MPGSSTNGVSMLHPLGGPNTVGSTINNALTNNNSPLGQKVGTANGLLPGGIAQVPADTIGSAATGLPVGVINQGQRILGENQGQNTLLGNLESQAPNTISNIFGKSTPSFSNLSTSTNQNTGTTPAAPAAYTPAPLAGLAAQNNTSQEDALRSAYLNALGSNYGMAFNNNTPSNQFSANPSIVKGK